MKKILVILFMLYSTVSYAAVSGEALMNVQDQTAPTGVVQANRVKDAATLSADAITSGIIANGGLLFNGTNWDRMPGDKTNGAYVNIKSSIALTFAGTHTPADSYTNPTDALNSFSLNAVWNGTGSVWNRWTAGTSDGDNGATKAGIINYGYNGTTADRIRAGGDNSSNPTLGKLYTIPARANAANPTWTEGNAAPLSTDLSGGLRVTGSVTPVDGFTNPTNTVSSFSLLGVWNGTVWYRVNNLNLSLDSQSTGLVPVLTGSFSYAFNGSTWDRVRAGGDNSSNPTLGKLYTIPARANASSPAWTEGNAVPISTDLFGNVRTRVSTSSFTTFAGITANTQLIASSGSTTIKIYGVNGVQASGTAGNNTLAYGTGSVCATGLTTLLYISGQNGNYNMNNSIPIATVPAGNNLCIYVGGSTPSISGTITYIQE